MESAGALTYSFIRAMQDEPKLSYGRLLNAMRSTIREAKEGHFGPDAQEFGMDTRLQHAHVLHYLLYIVYTFLLLICDNI